jgi:signal transduction histidine kinase/FixJ family two-component response regulator
VGAAKNIMATARPTAAAPSAGAPQEPRGLDLGLSGRSGLSFQSRVAVVALVTAVVVLLAACALFMLQQWRTERSLFLQSQTHLAQIAAADTAQAMDGGQPEVLKLHLDALRHDPRIVSARFIGADGRVLAGFDRSSVTAGADDPVTVTAPMLQDGRRVGTVVLRAEPDGLMVLAPRFMSMGGALFFVAAGLALFMGRWLAGRLTRPVERLSLAMQAVADSGDFAQRVRHGENDEFGRLTHSFNELLAQLEKNDVALRSTLEALVEARDAAEAANVLKSQFLANMSHEIRTPLNGVLAMAQIMAMSELADPQRERLAVIRTSGEALLTVLNDILDLSKIEAGRMELEEAEFDTAEVARNLEAAHAPMAADKGLKLQVELTPAGAGVRRGDQARLLQILNNLASNAIKFTSHGEVRVLIDGDGEDGAAGLRIAVSDTGIGIPADKLPQLFQKFMQVDASTTRQFGGTGLGLAICRELAQLMGGDVWAESTEGEGSRFFARLPLLRTSAADGEASPRRDRSGAAAARPLRVLAAEDNPTNQLVLKTVMATFGLQLDVVDDGRKAVEAWAQGDYDLILMDIQMPGMDGMAATCSIRAIEARTGRARTPIVALSANAMTHQVREYLQAGMDMHVAKPLQLEKLQEAIELAINAQAGRGPAQDASGGDVRAHQA